MWFDWGAADAYPSESIREELSVKLDLTDRQLQMWFCHRRLKDRNNATSSSKRARNDATGEAGEVGKKDVGSELGEGRKRKAMSQLLLRPPAVGRMEMDVPFMRRHYEPPPGPRTLSILERRAISFVESQLGEPLREDGPVLGIEFDPLPPDAFGAPLGILPNSFAYMVLHMFVKSLLLIIGS